MEFNVDEARKKWQLTDEEFEENINEIFSQLALCATKTSNPSFIIVGGQAGSGKGTLVAKENQDLEGNAIIIDQDELRTKFPREKYKQIHDEYSEREEYLILKPYISRAIVALKDRAVKNGYNIIFESALRSINTSIKIAQELKNNGYTTKLSVIVVPEVEANISMLTRYCQFLKDFGECRRNTKLDPLAAQSVRTNIERLDDLGIFDDITIWIRGKTVEDLPVQKYSKKIDTELTPVQAYDEWRIRSLDDTRRNFFIRYEQIKATLIQFGEHEQLEKLESIREAFEKQMSEMR